MCEIIPETYLFEVRLVKVSGVFGVLFGVIFVTVLMGLGVAAFAVWLIVCAVRAVARRLSGGPQPSAKLDPPVQTRRATHESYRHQDVDHGATSASIGEVMAEYVDDSVVGPYAQDVIDTLDLADCRKQSLLAEIDHEFERESISWDRFTSTANSAFDALLRNCALLANRVQSFDVNDYRRMQEFYDTGGFQTHGQQDQAKLLRWKLLDETKHEMDGIRSTNQQLLLELGKLSSELSKLSTSQNQDESMSIAEEVSKLVEQTKYYR
ncbi:MAG: hypothetical protein Q4A01_06885 [Coriobacteriales bacterium]|nr:hypothetical protein [Coriobacteriales bacterium]